VVMWKEDPADAVCRYFQVYSCGENRTWEMGRSSDGIPPGDDLIPAVGG